MSCIVKLANSERSVRRRVLLAPWAQNAETCSGCADRIGAFANVIFTCGDIQQTYRELAAKGIPFSILPVKPLSPGKPRSADAGEHISHAAKNHAI
ncbi:MAG: hypothetical protein M1298_02565 [Chloroflexi bacterium]|nr:hypothetical protein [Chloroflexota bacterium]